jgi:mono/diheme cytochrome c family protein
LSYYCTFATEEQREAKFLKIMEFIDRISIAKVFSQCLAAAMAIVLASCAAERRKSDAELGLNAQQASGRRVYDNYCARCHEPYSSRDKQGPSLQGVFKHQYLAVSGLPANDERVGEIIRYGRGKMQGFSQALTQQQVDDLLAYLKTL